MTVCRTDFGDRVDLQDKGRISHFCVVVSFDLLHPELSVKLHFGRICLAISTNWFLIREVFTDRTVVFLMDNRSFSLWNKRWHDQRS